MALVKDLLQAKYSQVWYVTPSSTVLDALMLMAEQKIGAVLVVEAGKIVGIFSERDFARAAAGETARLDAPVSELMVRTVYYVTPEQTVESCMALMTARRFRHLPVLDGEKLVGVISIGDVVKQLMLEKDMTIKSLEDYIWVHMI
ncbi:MAG: CBS domain-containing protein [Bellilinea sp.]|jgi:CBS domain-containing protein